MGCVLLVAACGGTSTPPASPGPPARSPSGPTGPVSAGGGSLMTGEFAGAVWSFVAASSTNGRFVFLYRFPSGQRPEFMHHGETDEPIELVAYDRFTGDETRIDELISHSQRRWFLVVAGGRVSLIDAGAGTWEQLDDIDMGADRNVCLAARHASFSQEGMRVAWIGGGARTLHMRDLVSGDEWEIASSQTIWRAWPDDVGEAAVLLEVPQGSSQWPAQRTSCACRWCMQFAASYGVYGWDGPDFTIMRVTPDGASEPGDVPEGDPAYDGPTDSGCTLVAAETADSGLARGPWRWDCPAD